MSQLVSDRPDHQNISHTLGVILVTWFLALAFFISDAYAQRTITKVNAEKHAGNLMVPMNQSEVIRLDVPFANLLVGNPKIADVLALTDRSIYVLGRELGTTSLIVSDKRKQLIAVLDIVVSHDIEGLKARLFQVLPDEKIEVRESNGSIILSGGISSSTRMTHALAVAKRYAPPPSSVINMLTVKGSQQVMLAVRFAEVARTVVKQLGLNTKLTNSRNNIAISAGSTLLANNSTANALLRGTSSFLGAAFGPIGIGAFSLNFLFDALEQRGVVKTLAEPNLIALSGDTASFLAGGEFPIPVAQNTDDGGTTITIEFKQFGVSLSFTPTVLDGDLINIVVAPEVSKIDTSNSVTISGFNIPGLTTRRAKTTVELRDGQTFAIAGLIQSDFADTISQIPGLGNVPILGALARSTDFSRDETELVILVTPYLVKPAEPGNLKTPADTITPASDAEMFLIGQTEDSTAGMEQRISPTLQGAGGIQGKYGHILR